MKIRIYAYRTYIVAAASRSKAASYFGIPIKKMPPLEECYVTNDEVVELLSDKIGIVHHIHSLTPAQSPYI